MNNCQIKKKWFEQKQIISKQQIIKIPQLYFHLIFYIMLVHSQPLPKH